MTPEEYERWMIRDCARCGRRASKSAEWSDGPICRTCYDRAMRIRGRCPRCDTDRLLPGRHTEGTPICRDCAGIVRDFFCDRCGFEGLLLGGRLCEHCNSDRSDMAALVGRASATGPMSVPGGRLRLHEQAAVLAAH